MTHRTTLRIAGGTLIAGAAALMIPLVQAAMPPGPGAAMADAATKFLAALSPEHKKLAAFTLEDRHRVEWFFVPIERKGIPLKKLPADQRALAHALLKAGLSQGGYTRATQIIELEKVLAEIEKNPVRRDPELYYVSVFGTPSASGTWGWRFEGHHLSLNFTVVKGNLIATTPQFMGTNPAEVRVDGPFKGRRVLGPEEDLARQLVTSLDEGQRKQAIYAAEAPADILTTNESTAKPQDPVGLPAKAMKAPQKATLRKLLESYAATMPTALAKERLARAERAGFDKLLFAWAGGLEKGQKHYYRVQGPTFLFEYDNTQNDANHVHTVWREFEGDFGRDLLREHLKAAH